MASSLGSRLLGVGRWGGGRDAWGEVGSLGTGLEGLIMGMVYLEVAR